MQNMALLFRRRFHVGQFAEITKTIEEVDIKKFSEISLDNNPIHLDETFASTTRFKRRIAHGMLVASLLSGVLGTKLPGHGAVYLSQSLKFLAPVYIDDTITARVSVTSIDETRRSMSLLTTLTKADGTLVITGEAQALLPKQPS